jgi:hypothetical protein
MTTSMILPYQMQALRNQVDERTTRYAPCPTGRTRNNHGEHSPQSTRHQRATCKNRPTITLPQATTRRVELPSPDDDDDTMTSPSAPVLEGACNCGSPEMQELLQDRRRGSTHIHLTHSSGCGCGSTMGMGTGMLKCTGRLPVQIPRGRWQGGIAPQAHMYVFSLVLLSFLLLILHCFYIDGRGT